MSELVAGRELDALVAEKVMGWRWMPFWTIGRSEQVTDLFPPYGVGDFDSHGQFPCYSTDIAAAWEVVEKMYEKGCSVVIGTNQCAREQNGVKFFAGYRGLGHSIFDAEAHPVPYAVDKTVPLAICLAALKAVEP